MTEKRAAYGPPLIWRTTASYYVHLPSLVGQRADGPLELEARDAVEAAQKTLEAVRETTPVHATIFNMVLAVSLVVPDRGE